MLANISLSWLLALPLVAASTIPGLSSPAAAATLPGLSNPAAVLDDTASKRTGNYTNECSDITIDDHQILHGWCAGGSHDDEGNANASLNLNLCVAYDHWSKALSWSPNGKFNSACKDCDVVEEGRILGCYCEGSDPDNLSLLDLDEGIENKNGNMACVMWG